GLVDIDEQQHGRIAQSLIAALQVSAFKPAVFSIFQLQAQFQAEGSREGGQVLEMIPETVTVIFVKDVVEEEAEVVLSRVGIAHQRIEMRRPGDLFGVQVDLPESDIKVFQNRI